MSDPNPAVEGKTVDLPPGERIENQWRNVSEHDLPALKSSENARGPYVSSSDG